MAHPAATLFALSLAVWVADVRFAPPPVVTPELVPVTACQSGPTVAPPADADVEVVICGARAQ